MANVKVILSVDEEILKNTFKEAHPDEKYSLESAMYCSSRNENYAKERCYKNERFEI